MARKSTSSPRTANVVVPFDGKLLCQLLARGVGGRVEEEFRAATKSGFVPFAKEIEPGTYSCSRSFRPDYLLSVMLSKFDDEKSSDMKMAAALEKFASSEEQCRRTNRNFASFVGGSLQTGLTVEACLYTASRKIQKVLGPLDLNEIAAGFGFGPGATTRLTKRHSDAWYKFSGKPETTTNNVIFANAIFLHSPLWKHGALLESEAGSLPYTVVESNHVVTVPKNALTDRVIAIEPDLNLFVQKGFGAVMRRRLQKVGVNLNDQTINQQLAKDGSVDGSLATLDLSNASDTVSRAIVEQLIPPDWLQALEQCRSQQGVLPSGKIIRYQKFSSMGNGFTFELESLIFWALCSSVADLTGETDRRISVYGDDIIVPTALVEPVIGLLNFCGFTTNLKKSFWSGPFRESCGKHYFLGDDVTPFFVRKQPRRLSDAFLLHNNVVRWAVNGTCFRDAGIDSGLFDFCQTVRSAVPVNWRKPRIPDGYGDGAFIGSFDECTPSRAPRGMCGWRAEVLSEPRVPSNRGGIGRLLKSLYRLETRPSFLSWTDMDTAAFSSSDDSVRVSGVGNVSERHNDATIHAHVGTLLPRHKSGSGVRDSRFVLNGQLREGVCRTTVPTELYTGDQRFGRLYGLLATHPVRREVKFPKHGVPVPLSVRARIAKILVPRWADLGPWF